MSNRRGGGGVKEGEEGEVGGTQTAAHNRKECWRPNTSWGRAQRVRLLGRVGFYFILHLCVLVVFFFKAKGHNVWSDNISGLSFLSFWQVTWNLSSSPTTFCLKKKKKIYLLKKYKKQDMKSKEKHQIVKAHTKIVPMMEKQ